MTYKYIWSYDSHSIQMGSILKDGVYLYLYAGMPEASEYSSWINEGNTPEPPDITPQEQIFLIERDTGVVRVVREFMIVSMRDIATRWAEKLNSEEGATPVTADQLLNANPAWVGVMDAEARIVALRALI